MRLDFVAARSSPGVTTALLACTGALPDRVLIVEASEDGGVLAARYGLALEPGLTTLAATRQDSDPAIVWDHTQVVPGTDGRVHVLVGPPGAESAAVLLRSAVQRLAQLMDAVPNDVTVLVDHGRLTARPAGLPLLAGSDRLVVVVRPFVDELQALARRLPMFVGFGPPVSVVPVGGAPYGPDEIAATLGCEVAGVLADDRASADALAGREMVRRADRRALLRSAVVLVESLVANDDTAARSPAEPAGASRPFTAAQP